MKRIYLTVAIIGFIVPTVLVVIESMETGNIFLYTNPKATLAGMFANSISSIFSIDLLFAVLVFFIWSFNEAKKHQIKSLYMIWILTLLFGLAGGFPLFLYLREKAMKNH